MKKIIFALILLASCTKEPVKKCYTVINSKTIQMVPAIYLVTLVSGKDTIKVKQSNIPVIGSNTCGTGAKINF